MPLDDLKKTITGLSGFNWKEEVAKAFENIQDAYLELQEDQLFTGRNSNGEMITLVGRGYAKKTFELKTAKGQPTDRITWKDTGSLYSALEAKIEGNEIVFSAPGEEGKLESMMERSGEETLGLNEQFKKVFADKIMTPSLDAAFNYETGLNIIQK